MTYTGYKHQRALILRPESNEGILEKDFTTVETQKYQLRTSSSC